MAETFNISINDSGCTKSVCGATRLKYYIDIISNDKKRKIKIENSCNSFRFGNNKIIKSNQLMKTPINISGVEANLTNDVLGYDIPLLLSKQSFRNIIEQ